MKVQFLVFTLLLTLPFWGCHSKIKNDGDAATYVAGSGNATKDTIPIKFNIMQEPVSNDEFRIVDQLIEDKKHLSADTLLNRMIAGYTEKGQWDGYVRAVMAKSRLISYQSDAQKKAIDYLESETQKAGSPAKAILYNVTAGAYFTYLNAHLHQLRNVTVGGDDADFSTWSVSQFLDKIHHYYSLSLADPVTKKIPIGAANLLTTEANTDKYAATLYDFLAMQVIDFFENSINAIDEPIYKFEIKGERYFMPFTEFVKNDIQSRDTLSRIYRSLQVYRSLLDHQIGTGNEVGLHRFNLKRLDFVHRYSIDPMRDRQLIAALDLLIGSGGKETWKAAYLLKKVALLHSMDQYNPEEPGRGQANYLRDIVGAYKKLIEDYPNTNEAKEAQLAIRNIETPSLLLNGESVQMPGRPFLMMAEYTNVTNEKINIFSIAQKDFVDYHHQQGRNDKKIFSSKRLVRTMPIQFTDHKDYRQHSTEFKIEGLEPGCYFLTFSDSGDDDSYGAYAFIQVADLAVVQTERSNELSDVFVVDRLSGAPVSGVKASVYEINYRQQSNIALQYTLTSDRDGRIELKNKENKAQFVVYEKNGSSLVDMNYFYQYRNRDFSIGGMQAAFFLDRAIYRPGQTVHFKSIVYELKDRIPAIKVNQAVNITLKDVNGQNVHSLSLRTNEFGSVNGSFTVPGGILTGTMALYIDNQYGIGFQVEEYKRPKFEIVMDTINEAYVLNDEIKTGGLAMNYAGSPVDGAVVKYTITRKYRHHYPFWREMNHFRMPPSGPEMIIAHGKTTTDETGRFRLTFTALPDEAYHASGNPRFIYDTQVDVTDINGETRTGTQQFTLGYLKYQSSISVDMNTTAEKLNNLKVHVHNSTGSEVDVKGRLRIFRLKAPANYLRSKMYKTPEEVQLSRSAYKELWPYEPYLDELDMRTWPIMSSVFDADDIPSNKTVDGLRSVQFQPGYYKISFDIKGQQPANEEGTSYVFVSGENAGNVYQPSAQIRVQLDKDTYQPGEKAVISMAVRNPSARALYEFYSGSKLVTRSWMNLATARQEIIEITEKYRGGVTANVMAYGYSRVESQPIQIKVPWSNKELQVTLKTFRTKLEPGSRETWELMINGPKKDIVAAEVLAGMYDASLDAFATNDYNKIGFPEHYFNQRYVDRHNASLRYFRQFPHDYPDLGIIYDTWRQFRPELLLVQNYRNYYALSVRGSRAVADDVFKESESPAPSMEKSAADAGGSEIESKEETRVQPAPSIRKNLEETVFFYPNLRTDAAGSVVLQFTMKEALTRWKMRVFAHTSDLKQGMLEQEVVTSKELMVFPNLPRYFRENDEVVLSAKINNMSAESGTVHARLELLNALTMQPLNPNLILDNADQHTAIAAGQSASVKWRVKSPTVESNAVIVRITAQNEAHSDGEENILPVLSNRMLITETMPMPLRSGQTRTFDFTSMLAAMASTTDQPFRYTLEYTSNPVWYAIQALPYLMEYPHECTEQILNRYFANTLAAHVANSQPKIKAVFDQWRNSDALESNLEKNEELKSALLEETPWVLQAQSEAQQKKNIALLFDLNRMANESTTSLTKLIERQNHDGGMPWFPGSQSSDYITSYTIEHIGHMYKLGVLNTNDSRLSGFIRQAVNYSDQRMVAKYEALKKQLKSDAKSLAEDHLGYWEIQYLYARSFFSEIDKNFINTEAYQYYVGQSVKYWNKRNHYANGMMALYLSRNGDKVTADKIVEGLRQTARQDDELGMHWPGQSGYFWYQLPIESHAMMIETFSELSDDKQLIDEMKLWLLKNKQTTHWKTTKGTSAAIFALMMTGGTMSLETVLPVVTIGEKQLDLSKYSKEAGTGYFKMTETGSTIRPEHASVTITNKAPVVNWGAAYYQYFEQMDKVKLFKETPLNISKTYNIVVQGDRGETLRPLKDGQAVRVGDKVRVRTVIRVDRPMEYIHLKDMRPAGLEPINTLSGYRYNNGLGYYESTKDVATHFFIDYLPAGTYVFEYDLRANLSGDYSTGISTIQSMYAPEFSSHSEGSSMEIK